MDPCDSVHFFDIGKTRDPYITIEKRLHKWKIQSMSDETTRVRYDHTLTKVGSDLFLIDEKEETGKAHNNIVKFGLDDQNKPTPRWKHVREDMNARRVFFCLRNINLLNIWMENKQTCDVSSKFSGKLMLINQRAVNVSRSLIKHFSNRFLRRPYFFQASQANTLLVHSKVY